MRQVNIRNLRPGMTLGRELLDAHGNVLLQKNVKLIAEYIQALESKGFHRLYIRDDDEPADIDIEDDISPEVRARAQMILSNALEQIGNEIGAIRLESSQEIAEKFESNHIKALLGKTGPLANMLSAVSAILESVMSRNTLAGVTSIKSANDFLYQHSLDVCAVSIMIGKVIGLSSDRLRQLAAGSLLHDIGKIFLDPELTGAKAIVQHTRLGYELLRAGEQQDILTPHAAYEHHERPDGKGLPRGLIAGNRIKRNRDQAWPIPTVLGEITAIANAYDHLLSGDKNIPPMTPDRAVVALRERAGTQYNEELITHLLRVIPIFPLGTEVVVRTGEYRLWSAVVVRLDLAHLDRPVIKLLHKPDGSKADGTEIDLNNVPDMVVQGRT